MALNKTRVQAVIILLISFCSLKVLCASDVLAVLWDEDVPLRRALTGDAVSDEDSKVLIQRLSKVPFTDQAKSDAWYKILRYRKPEALNVEEWQKYEPLLPNLPISVLRKVNFSDDLILTYFGQQKLKQVQLTFLAEEIAMKDANLLDDNGKILKLGNILCGFSPDEINTLKASTLRFKACSMDHLRVLAEQVKGFTVLGPPRIWAPETVRKVGNLIAGLSPSEIGEIPEKSFSQITPDVIELTPADTLRKVKDSQLKNLNKSSLLTWRRKTRDLRMLYLGRSSNNSIEIILIALMSGVLMEKWRLV